MTVTGALIFLAATIFGVLAYMTWRWRSPENQRRLENERAERRRKVALSDRILKLSLRLQAELGNAIAIAYSDDSEATRKEAREFLKKSATPIAKNLHDALLQRFNSPFRDVHERIVIAHSELKEVLKRNHETTTLRSFDVLYVSAWEELEAAITSFDRFLGREAEDFQEYRAAFTLMIFLEGFALPLELDGDMPWPSDTDFAGIGASYLLDPLRRHAGNQRTDWGWNHYERDNEESTARPSSAAADS